MTEENTDLNLFNMINMMELAELDATSNDMKESIRCVYDLLLEKYNVTLLFLQVRSGPWRFLLCSNCSWYLFTPNHANSVRKANMF